MDILQKIVRRKADILALQKERITLDDLQKSVFFERKTFSLKKTLMNGTSSGIIAEFKRKSPSKGIINNTAKPQQTALGYVQAGASGVSVLTDSTFFGGSNDDLTAVRKSINAPVLRKDFIIDPYQIYEAKSIGADVILLIAEILTRQQVKTFVQVAHSLGLEVLLELHDETQKEKIFYGIDMIGINNRNLKTFQVDIQQSLTLIQKLPAKMVYVSESGLSNPDDILKLKKQGFQGFLIGETFMKTAQPVSACKNFIQQLYQKHER